MTTRTLLLRLVRVSLAALLASVALVVSSCASDFEAISKLRTVRMLATRADKPYAKPGDTVTLETLAYDARADKSRPMQIFWIPFTCINPIDDLYYVCFAQFLAAAGSASDGGARDGGVPGGAGALLRPGVDLSPFLPNGPKYSFTLPPDIIDKHPIVPGSSDPYGLAIVFNIACAGHVEITPIDSGDLRKQQVPIGCFDADHNQLGADDFVIGVQRVYAYADRSNANPVVDHVTYQGQPLDLTQGITAPRCLEPKRQSCPDLKIDVVVTDASWETNPGDTDANGNVRNEQLWADYYTDKGDFDGDARLLFDPVAGRIADSATKFHTPNETGDGIVFVVVHDNRGGAAWLQFPVHVQ
jgi:hypothetical protein